MTDHTNPDSSLFQEFGNLFCDNGLSAPRPHRADRDDRNPGWDHCLFRPEKKEIDTFGKDERGFIHQFFMRDIAIGKDDLLDMTLSNQSRKLILWIDGDSAEIVWTG
jgi:hypothetical protein